MHDRGVVALQAAGLAAIAAIAAASATRAPALWGLHSAGFLPAATSAAVLAGAAAAIALAPRIARRSAARRAAPAADAASDAAIRPPAVRRAPLALLALGVLAAALWFLRERAYFLGDARAMLRFYETDRVRLDGHALLTTLVNFNLYRAFASRVPIAPQTVIAATSVVAGALFAALALRATARRAGALGDPWIARAFLLSGGVMALFAGYVENYGLVVPVILLYLVAGIDAVEGRSGLARPFALLLLAMGFHFVGFTLIPSFAVIAWRHAVVRGTGDRSRGGTSRSGAAAAIALVVVASGAAAVLMRFSRDATLAAGGLGRHLHFLPGNAFFRAYGFLSADHLLDIANEMFLLLPTGGAALAVLIASRRARRALAEPAGAFLAAATAGGLGFLLVFVAEIGAARDWDLFAFAAIPTALLAGRVASRALGAGDEASDDVEEREESVSPSRLRLRAAAVIVAAAQLANTLAFLLVNANASATVARARVLMTDERRLSPHARSYGAAFLAPLLMDAGQVAESIPYYETMIRYRPDEVGPRVGLAVALDALGRSDEAVAAASRALDIDPRDPRAYAIIGTAYYKRTRYAEAAEWFRRSLALHPDPLVLGSLGVTLANLEQFPEAKEALEAGLAGAPDQPSARLHLGFVYARLGRTDDARRVYQALLADRRVAEAARTLLSRLDPASDRPGDSR